MFIECLPTGMFGSNCYIAGIDGEGIVIDPGAGVEDICKIIDKNKIKIKYIILTHGHIDHICTMDMLRERVDALVLVHEADASAISDPEYNGSALFARSSAYKAADRTLKDGDVLKAGGMTIEIIHTPGHSPGSICIKIGNNIFTGDTLFRRSIGRTDLGNGSYKDIMNSINSKLMVLDDEVTVYPGHGETTTIGYEGKNNPFIRRSQGSRQ